MIFGGQSNPGDYHCNAFDEESIKRHLQKTGFSVIDYQEVDTPQTNGFINLNMTVKAVKKANIEKINIAPSNTAPSNTTPSTITQIQNIKPKPKVVDGKHLNIV